LIWQGDPARTRALLRDTVDRLQRILPRRRSLIIELRQSLADIGEE
jgi:hypothetical protein